MLHSRPQFDCIHFRPRDCQQTKQKTKAVTRNLAPMLFFLAFTAAAHAQGSVDLSGATNLMNSFKTFVMYAGAVICLGSLVFSGIKMMSGNFQQAIPGLFGALFGAGVLGWGAGWIGSLTGQSM
ncbi:MAG: TrbC/VirB2 family protein [Janthinobacterium lividum]